MKCSIPVSENKALEIEEFFSEKRDFVIFKDSRNICPNAVFFLIHGTPQGDVAINGTSYPIEQLANSIANKVKYLDESVTKCYTISCYGGKQKECTAKGVHFRSLHQSCNKIYASLLGGTKGYALNIFI